MFCCFCVVGVQVTGLATKAICRRVLGLVQVSSASLVSLEVVGFRSEIPSARFGVVCDGCSADMAIRSHQQLVSAPGH